MTTSATWKDPRLFASGTRESTVWSHPSMLKLRRKLGRAWGPRATSRTAPLADLGLRHQLQGEYSTASRGLKQAVGNYATYARAPYLHTDIENPDALTTEIATAAENAQLALERLAKSGPISRAWLGALFFPGSAFGSFPDLSQRRTRLVVAYIDVYRDIALLLNPRTALDKKPKDPEQGIIYNTIVEHVCSQLPDVEIVVARNYLSTRHRSLGRELHRDLLDGLGPTYGIPESGPKDG